ncbi:cysteine--tRNA ligase-like protein, mitochondrial isoform X2 [Tachypleus tridentatus]|uniref:cysteine--tRNA ligase-like protein, mitochondrial isoform X2 n=1 Tax=Tachypleus tridentatus TaxID=6853 RepID=UPI003FD44203
MLDKFCRHSLQNLLWVCHNRNFQMMRTFGHVSVRPCALYSKDSHSPEKRNSWEWRQPEGWDTGIQVYNSIVGRKVPLILRNHRLATWYMCGPTVYDESHIGHACCYVRFDIIRRILEDFFNIDVVMVMGITDIDDKIIARAREYNVTLEHITKFYEQDFFCNMESMKVKPPTVITRVTEHIPHIMEFCQKLIDNGSAYVTKSGTVYFDVKMFGNYGKFSNIKSEDEQEASDLEKRNLQDFAVWKAHKAGEPWWSSPWGKGRPGWHIECSAMASHIFGSNLDVHSGGKDLIFPHHENEEAQSEAFHGTCLWANYWLHTGHLYLSDGVKMSKSLKNTLSVKEFLQKNTANEFRICCLKLPYRHDIAYTDNFLEEAKVTNKKLKSFITDAEAYLDGHLSAGPFNEPYLLKCLSETRKEVKEALEDGFNTSKALDSILNLVNEAKKDLQKVPESTVPRSAGAVGACLSYVTKTLNMFGIEYTSKKACITSQGSYMGTLVRVLDSLVKFRSQVRVYALTMGPSAQSQYQTDDPNYKLEQDKEASWNTSEGLPVPPIQPPLHKGDITWTTPRLNHKERQKIQRKEREPLVKACDVIRDELYIAGIQIKDRGKDSSWSLLENISVDAKRTSLGSYDPFEPEYKPKTKT